MGGPRTGSGFGAIDVLEKYGPLTDLINSAKARNAIHNRIAGTDMRAVFLISFVFSLPAFADEGTRSLSGCLPSIADKKYEPAKCILGYQQPPPLKQDIKVTACAFLGGEESARDNAFRLMNCSVTNGSKEPIEMIRYGIRYVEEGAAAPLLEGGFDGPISFSTANINGTLQPGETRIIGFAGPGLPQSTANTPIIPTIEVLGARTPGSYALR